MIAATTPTPEALEARAYVAASRAPKLRTMRQFAEHEVVLPRDGGPFENRRFRVDRQPAAGLWLDALDSLQWSIHVLTSGSQQGKTLLGVVIPTLYHLFEHVEPVVFGVIDMDMANDKWQEDLLPAIEQSRYVDMLPRSGSGSRGGKVGKSVRFENGATLRFMSLGGRERSKAGFTSRVVVITELDGMAVRASTAQEANVVEQLIARTNARRAERRIYAEGTLTVEEAFTWQSYLSGTHSRILLPCPHCRRLVQLEREDLHGWEAAADKLTAGDYAAFYCNACGEAWSEQERQAANQEAVLFHEGQEVARQGRRKAWTVRGKPKRTDTFGLRWSAVNNLFVDQRYLGEDEWEAKRAVDEDDAERKRCHFTWAIPWKPPALDLPQLQAVEICGRSRASQVDEQIIPSGIVPAGTEYLTVGSDVGLYVIHWSATAWLHDGSPHVVDYGKLECLSHSLGKEAGITAGLQSLLDLVREGWQMEGTSEVMLPAKTTVDVGYEPDVAYDWLTSSGALSSGFCPTIGRGGKHYKDQKYRPPKDDDEAKRRGWHPAVLRPGIVTIEFDANTFKARVHDRVSMPLSRPGAFTVGYAGPVGHMSYAQHLTAENKVTRFVHGKGLMTEWVVKSRQNHWLDTTVGTFVGRDILSVEAEAAAAREQQKSAVVYEGQGFQPRW